MSSKLVQSGTHRTSKTRKAIKKPAWRQARIPGIAREREFPYLHPFIKEGLKMIAYDEKRSVSWLIAEILGDYLGVNCLTGEITSITKYTRPMLNRRKRSA